MSLDLKANVDMSGETGIVFSGIGIRPLMIKPVLARAAGSVHFHWWSQRVTLCFIGCALKQPAPTTQGKHDLDYLLKRSRYRRQLQKISVNVGWNNNKLIPKDG